MTAIPEPPGAISSMSSLSYPRTGKRGVPQQFPRRLFEMLESEANLIANDANHCNIISWSDSGNAFRILDVTLFSSHILPKYFRTSKFSSFQRNLNLYGFSKVRRGPDTDMYAHPSFVRGRKHTLTDLRKCNSAAARKRVAIALESENRSLKVVLPIQTEFIQISRAVSPSQSPPRMHCQALVYPTIVNLPVVTPPNPHVVVPYVWSHMTHVVPVIHTIAPPAIKAITQPFPPKTENAGTGRLNLLAMAMTSIEREARFATANTHTAHAQA